MSRRTFLGEFLAAMDRLAPGVAGDDTLLYGVEMKFYSSRLELSPRLETPLAGLHAAGDGVGVTRGLTRPREQAGFCQREALRFTSTLRP